MIDRLRSDLLVAETGGRAETDTMKQLLSGTRKELDAERYNSSKLRNDIERTISRIKELEVSPFQIVFYGQIINVPTF